MNLDHHFFRESELSEDQKKRSSPKIEDFFPRIQVKTKKLIQTSSSAQMHIKIKLLEGMQICTVAKLLGGISPHPFRVSAPLVTD